MSFVKEQKYTPEEAKFRVDGIARMVLSGKIKVGLIDAARFWSRVISTDGCWVWRGLGKHGHLLVNQKQVGAHRFSYMVFKGAIPKGLFVCHRCDNPPCVNPDHLWLGTAKENQQDCVAKGRKKIRIGDENPSRKHPERLARGESHPRNKLTDAQKKTLYARVMSGEMVYKIAHEFGIGGSAAHRIVSIMKQSKPNLGSIKL